MLRTKKPKLMILWAYIYKKKLRLFHGLKAIQGKNGLIINSLAILPNFMKTRPIFRLGALYWKTWNGKDLIK